MSFIVNIHTEFEEHTFCPTGDLWLEIGAPKVRCLVSSSAMAAASPVFRAMLFGGFTESKPADGVWLVRLPDDDIVGFYPLLSIAHGDWEEVPTCFTELEGYDPCSLDYIRDTLQFVYQVAKLADKYDCTRLLRPVAESWCRAISRATMYPNAGYEIDGSSVAILWTGWVFGDKGMIEAELRRVYLRARVEEYADDDTTMANDDTTLVNDESEGGLMIRDEETDFLPLWAPGLFRSSSTTDACQILNLLNVSGMFF
ncbi:hypothetical protein GE09DRAFT_1242858 [Coniochaeta sp. 2T2.1]|nr:hypothetical protein GE09DRAFT_1242858 [Coniochaeta sp. 2T2.1]